MTSRNKIINVAMDSSLPLDLHINSELSVRCNSIARHLPDKRIVYQGKLGDRDVFIKHYFDSNRARIHWQREDRGLMLMQDRGIHTAEIIYSGKVANDSGYVIVTRAIESADDFASVWKDSVNNDNKRTLLLSALMDCVAAHHNAGLLQKDIHLGNFLVSNNTVYTLDGSDIEDCSPMSTDKALSNLALLAAQFLPTEDSLVESLFSHYANKRNNAVDDNMIYEFIIRRDQQRETRKQRYLKKIFRQSTATTVYKSFYRRCLLKKQYDTPELREVLADPDRFIEGSARSLKKGGSSTVAVITVGEQQMVIKRYNIKSPWHALSRAWRPSRAAVSWRNAHMLLTYGIPTASPIAMVEHRFGPLFGKAYFICEHLSGDTARDYFAADVPPDSAVVLGHIREILALMKQFHIAHGDMKATNFLIQASRVWVIDLDGMRQIKADKAFHRARRKDIMRLLQNWEPGSDQEKMFKEIVGPYDY